MRFTPVRWIALTLMVGVGLIALTLSLQKQTGPSPPGCLRIVPSIQSGALVLENLQSDWDPEASRSAPSRS